MINEDIRSFLLFSIVVMAVIRLVRDNASFVISVRTSSFLLYYFLAGFVDAHSVSTPHGLFV